jgi:hypothetical protein
VYAHAMHDEETDLSFAEFGSPGRPSYEAAPADGDEIKDSANSAEYMRRMGFGLRPQPCVS